MVRTRSPKSTIGYLILHSNENLIINITRAPLVFGRLTDADYVLSSPACSNRHFRIYSTVFEEGKTKPLIFCEDLRSLNGTFVNGRRVATGCSVILLPGDVIEIKDGAKFEFQIDELSNPSQLDTVSEKEKHVFENYYRLTNRLLGEGGYGAVCLAHEIETGDQVACKIVDLARFEKMTHGGNMMKNAKDVALREARILARARHPNIVDVRRVFVTTNRVYIFQEMVTHGDLFGFMHDKGRMCETDVMAITWQILKGLTYLHDNNVVHRDLKPENILMTGNEIGARVIIADFGAARFMTANERIRSIQGTLEFTAPEILRRPLQGYSKCVDIWSLGVIVYQLLVGTAPFLRADTGCRMQQKLLTNKILNANLEYIDTDPDWENISPFAKDFVRQLICVEERNRLTTHTAMEHPWLSRHTKELDSLYERATRNWKERYGEIVIEDCRSVASTTPLGELETATNAMSLKSPKKLEVKAVATSDGNDKREHLHKIHRVLEEDDSVNAGGRIDNPEPEPEPQPPSKRVRRTLAEEEEEKEEDDEEVHDFEPEPEPRLQSRLVRRTFAEDEPEPELPSKPVCRTLADKEDINMDDVPGIGHGSPISLEGEPRVSWDNELYSKRAQEMYDSVVGDGRMRNAEEIFRELEKKKSMEEAGIFVTQVSHINQNESDDECGDEIVIGTVQKFELPDIDGEEYLGDNREIVVPDSQDYSQEYSPDYSPEY